jgi:hypothetical protein
MRPNGGLNLPTFQGRTKERVNRRLSYLFSGVKMHAMKSDWRNKQPSDLIGTRKLCIRSIKKMPLPNA